MFRPIHVNRFGAEKRSVVSSYVVHINEMAAKIAEIIVDTREHDLIELFSSQEIKVKSLDVGDVHLIGQDIVVAIERKSLADLAASIKDGRYKEQKQRLNAFMNSQEIKRVVVIIVEGRFSYDSEKPGSIGGLSRKAILSAVLNSQMRDGFKVITTESKSETRHAIVELAKRIESHVETRYNSKYEPCVVKTVKKENNDKMNSYLVQLSSIPLVSLKTAESIARATHSTCMAELVVAIRESWRPTKKILLNPAILANLIEYVGVEPDKSSKSIGDYFPKRGFDFTHEYRNDVVVATIDVVVAVAAANATCGDYTGSLQGDHADVQ